MEKINFKYKNISGWNNYPKLRCKIFRPEKIKDLHDIIDQSKYGLISRGQGKSYGDASLNHDGVVLTHRIDKFIDFNKNKGKIVVQSGLLLQNINELVVKEGWFLPVVPGTQLISVGGAFACDVHGKNNYLKGSFSDHVCEIKLLSPNNKIIKCSPNYNKDIFWSTAGGMGLTGIIIELTIKLIRINSTLVDLEIKKVSSLAEMINCFRIGKVNYQYMVGWIDNFATGKKLGTGIFQGAKHHLGNIKIKKINKNFNFDLIFYLLSFFLNSYVIYFFNKFKLLLQSRDVKKKRISLFSFLTPLDKILNWNKIYGSKGLLQYQFILPDNKNLTNNLYKILLTIQQNKTNSYLTVIKLHRSSKGYLSFPIDGFSVACDFPNTKDVKLLIKKLNKIVIDLDGKVYLAKDSLLTGKEFKKMYSTQIIKWEKIISKSFSNNDFNSELSKRIKLKYKNE